MKSRHLSLYQHYKGLGQKWFEINLLCYSILGCVIMFLSQLIYFLASLIKAESYLREFQSE